VVQSWKHPNNRFLYVGWKCKNEENGPDGSRDECTCFVALSLEIRSLYVESAGAGTRGFTSIYPAVNFFLRSPPRRLRSRAIQSNRCESARFRLLMRTHVASCAREMRKCSGDGIALKVRKKLLKREKIYIYICIFYNLCEMLNNMTHN